MLYLDTSAVLKLYLREAGARSFHLQISRHAPWLFTSRVTYPETHAGLTRAWREGRITKRTYRQKRRQFESDWLALHIVEVTEEMLIPSADLIESYSLRVSMPFISAPPSGWRERFSLASTNGSAAPLVALGWR